MQKFGGVKFHKDRVKMQTWGRTAIFFWWATSVHNEIHVLHDAAQKTVFGHRHTRGSFLRLEPSLVEPWEELEYESSWVINAVVHRLPALQTQNGVYSGQGRLAVTPPICSCFSVFSRQQKRTLCTEVAKLCSKAWDTQTLWPSLQELLVRGQ